MRHPKASARRRRDAVAASDKGTPLHRRTCTSQPLHPRTIRTTGKIPTDARQLRCWAADQTSQLRCMGCERDRERMGGGTGTSGTAASSCNVARSAGRVPLRHDASVIGGMEDRVGTLDSVAHVPLPQESVTIGIQRITTVSAIGIQRTAGSSGASRGLVRANIDVYAQFKVKNTIDIQRITTVSAIGIQRTDGKNEALTRALEPRDGSLPGAMQTSALYSAVHADMHGKGASDASESELTDTPPGGTMFEGTASLRPNKALTRALGAKDGPLSVAPASLQSSLQEVRTNTMHVGMQGEGASKAPEPSGTPLGGVMTEDTANAQPKEALMSALGARDGPPAGGTLLQSGLQEAHTSATHGAMQGKGAYRENNF